ncbi:chaperone for protein-folding within the ER, fungal-domain-containing protein [Mycena sanguinolenta]|nr:chaperone for protein-folding within the ER, fungal-domain-containing protein [Mycena sanguinolenta]
MLGSLFALVLAGSLASAQDYTADQNTTSITGTWSSGTQNVVPGSVRLASSFFFLDTSDSGWILDQGFANPAQETFIYPKASGVGYSFTDDGWYELARFRYTGNSSHPECIVGTVVWAHGTYDLLDNGSIILTPIGDGYQQVQSPCNKDNTNFIQDYNITETYASWRIFTDVTFGPKLHLFEFDGSPVAPLFRVSDQPNMLPQQKLRNIEVQVVTTTSAGFITTETIMAKRKEARHDAQRRGWSNLWPVW